MKLSWWKTPAFRHDSSSRRSTQVSAIVPIANIIGQVCRGVPLRLRNTIAHPREPVAAVLVLEVFKSRLPNGFKVVKRRSRPDNGRLSPVRLDVMAVSTVLGPNHLFGRLGNIGLEVSRRSRLQIDSVKCGLGLILVDERTDVIYLCFNARYDWAVGSWTPWAG